LAKPPCRHPALEGKKALERNKVLEEKAAAKNRNNQQRFKKRN
jgi:hypothetical protein